MIISIKSAAIASMAIASSTAFTLPSSASRKCRVGSSCSLQSESSSQHQEIDVHRRQVLQQTFTVAASTLLLPQWAVADAETPAKPASPAVANTIATPTSVEKKETLKADATTANASSTSTTPVEKKEVLKAEASTTTQPVSTSFTSTPKYEKEIVTADASGASSSTTTVSSSTTPVKEKEVVKISQQPAPAPAPLATPPPAPKLLTQESYAVSIQQSTSALSTQLGHAFSVVDGLNTQARRISASSHPTHGLAVLEGMNVQAKRLEADLTSASTLYKTIIQQAKLIAVPDDSFEKTVAGVTRASSVLDGVIVQSKRLVTASGVVSAGGGSTDDQIMYMLSVLDGLNVQMKRLNVKETFGLLDELNSKAEKVV